MGFLDFEYDQDSDTGLVDPDYRIDHKLTGISIGVQQ
jgi:hypothetical protein